MEQNFIKLGSVDFDALWELSESICATLENPDYLIPYTEQEAKQVLGDPAQAVFGLFCGGKLICSGAAERDLDAFDGEWEQMGIDKDKTVELGESMTLPEHRGQGLMLRVNTLLCSWAKENGYEYAVATAHPDNAASNRSLQKLGMVLYRQFTRNSLPRNIYVKKL